MSSEKENEFYAHAQRLSNGVLWEHAADVDRRNRFPAESVAALRDVGLFQWSLCAEHGGLNGTLSGFQRVAATLGAGCPSTALIWVMHCQQVAVMSRYGAPAAFLREVAQGALVASVTTEENKGGDLLRAETPLTSEGDRIRLKRAAPIVSYGQEASIFVLTAKASESRPATDTVLVVAHRTDGQIQTTGGWSALGMRGTQSIPMSFDLAVNPDQVLSATGRKIAIETMIPWGHVGWASAWVGAARGALSRFVKLIRQPGSSHRYRATSDRFLDRLARIRLSIDLGDALVAECARAVDRLVLESAGFAAYEDITFQIRLNGAKAAAASLAFEALNSLMELAGLHTGYLETSSGIERVFRDLRSASLMYHNDRLMEINGRLQLVEGTALIGSQSTEPSSTELLDPNR